MIDPNMPLVQDNFKVCLLTGPVMNPLALVNEEFGIFAQNCYRIRRTVEMYQWKETQHSRQVPDGENRTRTEYYYTHHRDWFSYKIDSKWFKE